MNDDENPPWNPRSPVRRGPCRRPDVPRVRDDRLALGDLPRGAQDEPAEHGGGVRLPWVARVLGVKMDRRGLASRGRGRHPFVRRHEPARGVHRRPRRLPARLAGERRGGESEQGLPGGIWIRSGRQRLRSRSRPRRELPRGGYRALEVEILARESERLFKAWERADGSKKEQDERWRLHEVAHRAVAEKRAELARRREEEGQVSKLRKRR